MASVTVQYVYDAICDRLLEPGGTQLGLFAEADFLDYFADVILDFCAATGFAKEILTQSIQFGVSEYTITDKLLRVEHAFVAGRRLDRETQEGLDDIFFEWRKAKPDMPRYWHEDELAIKTVELVPAPNFDGVLYPGPQPPFSQSGDFFAADRNLTTIGSRRPDGVTYTLATTIPLVPDSAVPYLAWGVLAKMLSADTELKDLNRATYCQARFQEGKFLFRAILEEELLDEFDEVAAF